MKLRERARSHFKYMQAKIVVSAQMEGRQGRPGGLLKRWKRVAEFAHKGENGMCRMRLDRQQRLAERESQGKKRHRI